MASEEVISEELGDIKIEYENLRSQLCKLENLLCQENGGEFGLSSRLQLQASKLFNKDQFSDVEVILKGGSHIKAHKMILAASGNDWGIEQFDQVDMLDLTDLRYEVGYALIKWVYTDDFGGYSIRMDDNFFVEMMQAAKVCQLKSLHVRCQKVLSTMVNNETCEKYLKLSEEFDAKILKDNCEKLLQKKKEVIHLHHPKDFDEEIVVTQMGSDNDSMDDADDGCDDENPEMGSLGDEHESSQNSENLTLKIRKDQSVNKISAPQDSISEKYPGKKKSGNLVMVKKIILSNEAAPKMQEKVLKVADTSLNEAEISSEMDVPVLISQANSKASSLISQIVTKDVSNDAPKLRNLLTVPKELNNSISKPKQKSQTKKDPNLRKSERQIKKSNITVSSSKASNEEDEILPPPVPVVKKKRNRKKRVPSKPVNRPKKYKCGICEQLFADPRSEEIHRKSQHLGIVLFTCHICGKEFKSESYRYHMQRHKASKDLVCHICGKTMSVARDLKRHIQYHNASKISCPYCDYTSQSKGAVNLHIRTHTDERPFTCSTCGKSFRIKNSLERHMLVHSEEKLYKCDKCPLEFKHPYRMNVHKKRIHGTGPPKRVACELCAITCCDKSTMKRHYRTKHANQQIPSESIEETVIVETLASVEDVEVMWLERGKTLEEKHD